MASPASYSSGIIYFELELFNFSGRARLSFIEPTAFMLFALSLCIKLVFRLNNLFRAFVSRFPKENVAKTRQKVKIA